MFAFPPNVVDTDNFLFFLLPVVRSKSNDNWIIFSYHTAQFVRVDRRSDFTQELYNKILSINRLFFGTPGHNGNLLPFQLILSVNDTCNLNCRYCFLDNNTNEKLNKSTAISNINKAIELCARHDRPLQIGYFGGEPTLDFPLIKYCTEYVKSIYTESLFSITTNGTFSNKWIQFFVEHDFDVSISMDGDRYHQNANRPFKSGKGSYDVVINNVRHLITSNLHPKIRITITDNSVHLMPNIVDKLSNMGVKEIHFEPVTICHSSRDNDVKKPAKELFLKFLLESLEKAKRRKVKIINSSFINLFRPVTNFCDGTNRRVVNSDGSISACVEVNKEDHFFSREFITSNLTDRPLLFQNAIIDNLDKCGNCFARHICGGGCPARNYHSNGNVNIPDDFGCYITRHVIPVLLSEFLYR